MDKIIFLFLDVFMKRFHKNSSKNIYICYGRINFISNNISIGIFFCNMLQNQSMTFMTYIHTRKLEPGMAKVCLYR